MIFFISLKKDYVFAGGIIVIFYQTCEKAYLGEFVMSKFIFISDSKSIEQLILVYTSRSQTVLPLRSSFSIFSDFKKISTCYQT